MMTKLVLAAALLAAGAPGLRAEGLDDTRLIDLWVSQKAACKTGDEKRPETWMACGRSDAFAAMLAARGLCLDAGQDVWRVGNGTAKPGDSHWRCSLVTS